MAYSSNWDRDKHHWMALQRARIRQAAVNTVPAASAYGGYIEVGYYNPTTKQKIRAKVPMADPSGRGGLIAPRDTTLAACRGCGLIVPNGWHDDACVGRHDFSSAVTAPGKPQDPDAGLKAPWSVRLTMGWMRFRLWRMRARLDGRPWELWRSVFLTSFGAASIIWVVLMWLTTDEKWSAIIASLSFWLVVCLIASTIAWVHVRGWRTPTIDKVIKDG